MHELALIIKVQSLFRGFLARKKIRGSQFNAGMGGIVFTENQKDYDNEKVAEIAEKLGEFNYEQDPNTETGAVEARPVTMLDNHAKYTGEWVIGEDTRQGKGKQIWPDGSMYDGWWIDNKAEGRGRLIHVDGDVY
jgi:hypothetical protein